MTETTKDFLRDLLDMFVMFAIFVACSFIFGAAVTVISLLIGETRPSAWVYLPGILVGGWLASRWRKRRLKLRS